MKIDVFSVITSPRESGEGVPIEPGVFCIEQGCHRHPL